MRDELSDPCLRDHRSTIGEDVTYRQIQLRDSLGLDGWFEDQMLESAIKSGSGATDTVLKQLQPAVCSAVGDTTVLDATGGRGMGREAPRRVRKRKRKLS